MAYLNTCTELDDLGKGRFRHVHHLKPIAYLENGVYKLSSANVAAYADGTYTHAVLAANIGVRIGNDGKYAIHPTRELARYVAFGGPQVKVGGKWTAVPFDKPTRKDNSVIWTQKQADLKLTHIGHGLKHEMWLKNGYVPEDNLIAVAVNLVGLTRSGSTLLADGVPVARIQAPVVYDADNREDTRPIKWDVVSRDGQPYIVYTLPDLTGMAAPVVDPTLTLQPGPHEGEDATLISNYPTYNAGAVTDFNVGNWGAYIFRSLIYFDLSSIPSDAHIVSATLSLWLAEAGNRYAANNRTIQLYRVKREWIEGTRIAAWSDEPATGCTWNRYDLTNTWTTAGCDDTTNDREATSIGSHAMLTTDAANSQHDFALSVAAVQEWVRGAVDNNGLIAIADTETDDAYSFCSSDHATAAYRPKLVVDYTLPVASSGGMLLLGVG